MRPFITYPIDPTNSEHLFTPTPSIVCLISGIEIDRVYGITSHMSLYMGSLDIYDNLFELSLLHDQRTTATLLLNTEAPVSNVTLSNY